MTNYSPMLALFVLAPRLRRASNRAVSIYLPARSAGYDARFYDIEFRDLLHRYRDRLSAKDQELMEYELRRLRHRVAVVRPAGCPAFAGFADEPNGVLELIKLRDENEERLEVGELLVAPILRQLEHYPPALIAVVDKEHAKTFGAILDEIIPLQEVNGVEVRHSRAGGTSASSNQRKAENRAKANLESAVKTVEREMSSGAYMHLYVAGPEEARATFERMLPERLKKTVAGHLSASLDSSELKRELREKVVAAEKR
jgi:release factor family 10